MGSPRSRVKLLLLVALPVFGLCLAGAGGVGVWLYFKARTWMAAAEVQPTVRITARYDAASPQEVERTVTIPLEVQLSGMEGLETIESVSGDDGTTITLYLRRGMDLDMAQVLAQNRVALAHPLLPDAVNRNGVRVTKWPPLPVLWLLLTSSNARRSHQQLQNFVEAELVPLLLEAPGVEGAHVGQGERPRRRLRFDPEKLGLCGLTLEDVAHAAGQLDQGLPEEKLDEMVVGKDPDGRDILVRDVARPVEEGPGRLEFARWEGRWAVPITVEGRDAGAAFASVRQRLPQLRQALKEDMELLLLPGPLVPGGEALVVEGRLPDGTSRQRILTVVGHIAGELARLPDAREKSPVLAALTLPSENPSGFRLFVALRPAVERDSSLAEVRKQARQILGHYRDTIGRVIRPEALARPPRLRAPVVLSLGGPDLEESVRLADAIRERLKAAGFVEVWPDYPRLVPQLHFDVDREKAGQLGVNVRDILDQLQIVGARQEGGRAEALGDLKIRGPRGEAVPLKAVVNVQMRPGPAYLRRIDGERRLLVTANPPPGVKPDEARRRCREIAGQNLPAGYTVECTGSDHLESD